MNNKGNWEFSFFQKTYDDKNYNTNKEATIKVALRPDNGFNPKNIQQYINPEKSKEEQILDKKKNKEQLNTKENIILNNYLEKQKAAIDYDKELIEKFSLGAKPTTKEGKIRLLLHTLDYQIKNNNYDFVANIYLRLLEDQFKLSKELKQEYSRLLNKMDQIISKLDLIKLQFTKFHTQMPPLNQKGFNKLDEWQLNVINNIDNNISTVISAPTSAGKSVISGYVTIKGRSLFVVPTDALAWQLSAYIGNILGTNVPILTKTYQTSPVRDDMVDILNKSPSIVGTASTIVDFLPLIKNDFKWVIFDEVHMIGKKEGFEMEYIAKILNVPFLALSATIGNIDELVEWFNSISNNKVDKIECNKRFFNLQRYYYDNNKLNVIHPFALITEDDFITGELLNKNLEPTPPDVWDLVEQLDNEFKLGNVSPYKYFNKDERIQLDKVNCYFKVLLKLMVLLYNDKLSNNKPKINRIIESFKKTFNENTNFKYSSLLFKLKEDQKLPAIVFQENTNDCLNLIKDIAIDIDMLESTKYPKLLADRMKMVKQVKKNEKKLDKEKLDDAMEKKSLKSMLENKTNNEELIAPHLQEPHIDFIFNTVQYFSNTAIEEYVNELKQYFPIVNDSYHYIIKLLWRGIGIYAQGLPDPYLRLVQTLANQKQLAVVFSDQSLVFGISMPFRSVVISKYNNCDLDSMLYHQMSGRAGRRGLDKEGNVIFAGYSWDKIKELSISSIPHIKGCNNDIYTIKQVTKLSNTNYKWSNLMNNYLDKSIIMKDNKDFYKDLDDNYNGGWSFMNLDDINYLHTMWKLRHNKDCIVLTYLLSYIKRYFENKNCIHETNQIEIAHLLCRFICINETNDVSLYLEEPKMLDIEPYNNILNELDNLQIETFNNIDKRLFLSIQYNSLYDKTDYKLREQLMNFGNIVKDLQHYYYHTKIIGITKLLGKLLTRIWWIYHLSSPILQ